MNNISSTTLSQRRMISLLALVAGASAGLASVAAWPRLAQAEPPVMQGSGNEDEIPDWLWQLSGMSADEIAVLMDDPAAPDAAPQPEAKDPPKSADSGKLDSRGRRVQPDEPTELAFKNVTVEQVVPFIVEATGKVVLPMPDVMSVRITILNDRKIPRARALDMVFLALQQNGVAVVETNDLIQLRALAEIDRQQVPVIPADESLLGRTDQGAIYEKVFAPKFASVANISDMIKNSLPSFAKMTVDLDSNRIMVMGDMGLLQRIESKIRAVDIQSAASLSSETFHLQFADATDIATNIRDLYAQNANQNRGGNNNQNPFAQFMQNRGGGGNNQPGGRGGNQAAGGATTARQPNDASASANLRVTANTQQNAVTVVAEKPVLDQIRRAIAEEWDVASEPIAPRVYELKNTDPVKMRDSLVSMFGSPGAQRQNNQQTGATANRLYGQFAFEAFPDAARLVVIAKNKANLAAIDEIIQSLDKPQTAGLPQIIELKHADAEQLAEQLNALLAREGTLAQVTKAQTGLNTSQTSASPFQSSTTTTNQATQQAAQNAVWQYWWARSQPPTTTAGSGNLVGKIRIVPVWRQNALMIMSPPEYTGSLREIITTLDNPGRQVLLTAVIAEINIEDATALGLRWSNSAITPANSDNAISFGASTAGNQAGGTITGVKNDLLPGMFTSSVLNLGVNVNALVQALGEKTSVNILSEPRIFTSDNQQAEFFSGQDIPFITQNQPATGNTALVQNFDYKAVGIALRVRPRITINRDVDININLELSSTQPGNTLFGGAIVDRRETTTHLIVKDGQTVVVSGILRNEDSDTRRKIPLLGDLPFIGGAFSSMERSRKKTELIAFVTPYVIGSESDIVKVDKRDTERLNDVRERLAPVDALDRDAKKEKAAAKEAADKGAPERVPTPTGSSEPTPPANDHP